MAQLETRIARHSLMPLAMPNRFACLALLSTAIFFAPTLRAQRPEAPMATGAVMQYRGVIKKLQSGSILLTLDDTRPLLVRTTGKTKYLQGDETIKSSQLKLGDGLTIEAALDPFSQLQAIAIHLLSANEAAVVASAASAPPPVDEPLEGNGRYTLRRGPKETPTPPQPPEGFDPRFLIERARIAA